MARRLVWLGLVMAIIGYLALMVSFWLPTHTLQVALRATAIALMVPGAAAATVTWVFWEEITRAIPPKKPAVPLRCTDCQNKLISVSGTTMGDQLELAVREVNVDAHYDAKGIWHPPTGPDNDPVHHERY